jgi:hypothetical protein
LPAQIAGASLTKIPVFVRLNFVWGFFPDHIEARLINGCTQSENVEGKNPPETGDQYEAGRPHPG